MKLIKLIKNEYFKLPGKLVIIILLIAVAYFEAYTYSVNLKYGNVSDTSYTISDYDLIELNDELSRTTINENSTKQEIESFFTLKAKSFIYEYIKL